MDNLFVQLFSIIGVCLAGYAFSLSNPRQTLRILSIKNAIMAVHFYLLGMHEAAIVSTLCIVRDFTASKYPDFWLKSIVSIFILFVWISTFLFLPDDIVGYMPAIATTIGSLACLARENLWTFRITNMSCLFVWISYYSIEFSLGGFLECLLCFIILLYASAQSFGLFKRPRITAITAE